MSFPPCLGGSVQQSPASDASLRAVSVSMASCGNVKVNAGGVNALRVKAAVLAKSGGSLTGATLTLLAPDGLMLSSGSSKRDLINGSKTLVMPLDNPHTSRAFIRADACLSPGTYYIPSVLTIASGTSTPGPTATVRSYVCRDGTTPTLKSCRGSESFSCSNSLPPLQVLVRLSGLAKKKCGGP